MRMIISSRSRVSNLLFSKSCISWLNATLATPGLLATTRNASLCVRRAGMPIASPSSRARSSDTIGTREVIAFLSSIEQRGQALLDAVGDVKRQRLDRSCRVHPSRGDEDAAIDDEQVLHVMAAAPFIHHGSGRVGAHARGPHQMPAAIGDRSLVPDVVGPSGTQDFSCPR